MIHRCFGVVTVSINFGSREIIYSASHSPSLYRSRSLSTNARRFIGNKYLFSPVTLSLSLSLSLLLPCTFDPTVDLFLPFLLFSFPPPPSSSLPPLFPFPPKKRFSLPPAPSPPPVNLTPPSTCLPRAPNDLLTSDASDLRKSPFRLSNYPADRQATAPAVLREGNKYFCKLLPVRRLLLDYSISLSLLRGKFSPRRIQFWPRGESSRGVSEVGTRLRHRCNST